MNYQRSGWIDSSKVLAEEWGRVLHLCITPRTVRGDRSTARSQLDARDLTPHPSAAHPTRPALIVEVAQSD
jgi:hypothetical protein